MTDMPAFDFGYLTLFTKDLEKTRAFYEAIGLLFTECERNGERSCTAMIGRTAYLTFKVGEPSDCELHFGVQAHGGVQRKLKELGYEMSAERMANPRGTFTYRDPDGRTVGLDEFG